MRRRGVAAALRSPWGCPGGRRWVTPAPAGGGVGADGAAAAVVLIQRDARGSALRQVPYVAEGAVLVPQRRPALAHLLRQLRAPHRLLAHTAAVHLLPRGYPDSVGGSYLSYVSWNALQTASGSVAGVLSMQALLGAVGLGGTGAALPLAATLNWVLKDGLGQLGGVAYAAVARNIDAHPKATNFRGIGLLQVACLLEFLTFALPWLFLPLAALGNVAKNVACISLSATRAAIHQSFTTRENLADVTAKAVSQAIVASMVGTGLGCLALAAIGPHFHQLVVVLAAVCATQQYAAYRSLSVLSFRIFNAHRLQRVLDTLWADGSHLTPEAVGHTEPFVFAGLPSGGVNPSLGALAISPDALREALRRTAPHPYVVLPHPSSGACVLLLAHATQRDVLRGCVTAYRTRYELQKALPAAPAPEAFRAALEAATHYVDEHMDALCGAWQAAGWELGHNHLETVGRRLEVLDAPANPPPPDLPTAADPRAP